MGTFSDSELNSNFFHPFLPAVELFSFSDFTTLFEKLYPFIQDSDENNMESKLCLFAAMSVLQNMSIMTAVTPARVSRLPDYSFMSSILRVKLLIFFINVTRLFK
jgi:hypothetical protein